MDRTYGGLESSVANHDFFRGYAPSSMSKEPARAASPYRSQSESIIADILEKEHVEFSYESDLRVSKQYVDGEKDRVWHPDFYLQESGVIIEYAGMTDNEEYMEGVERKKEIYEAMGLDVVWLYPEDLWEPANDNKYGKLRDDVQEHIVSKIEETINGHKVNKNSYFSKPSFQNSFPNYIAL